MPVLDRVAANTILDRFTPDYFRTAFHRALIEQQPATDLDRLRRSDWHIVRVMLERREAGRAFATPIALAREVRCRPNMVRHGLRRLRAHKLLPFEVHQ